MKKKTFAWVRAVAAVAAAVVLLAVTGFAFAELLRGPAAVADGLEMEEGAYVQADLTFVMDICGVEKNTEGKPTAYFAVAPVGNTFTLIRIPASSYDNVLALEEETQRFLEGTNGTMAFHLVVSGTAVTAGEDESALLARWFEGNAVWMSQSGVIGAVEDYEQYLCPMMIEAERIHGMSFTAAAALSILALVLVVYAIVELALIFAGVYSKKTARKPGLQKPKYVRPEAPEHGAEDADV